MIQQGLIVRQHKNLCSRAFVNKGVDYLPEDAEYQVAVDDEEGLQAFRVVVLLVEESGAEEGKDQWREGGMEGVSCTGKVNSLGHVFYL